MPARVRGCSCKVGFRLALPSRPYSGRSEAVAMSSAGLLIGPQVASVNLGVARSVLRRLSIHRVDELTPQADQLSSRVRDEQLDREPPHRRLGPPSLFGAGESGNGIIESILQSKWRRQTDHR